MKYFVYPITGVIGFCTVAGMIGISNLQREQHQQRVEIEALKVMIAAAQEREKRWVEIMLENK